MFSIARRNPHASGETISAVDHVGSQCCVAFDLSHIHATGKKTKSMQKQRLQQQLQVQQQKIELMPLLQQSGFF